MKKLHPLLLLAPALALVSPPPVSAQNPPNRPPGKSAASERNSAEKRQMGSAAERRDPRHVKTLLGREVVNTENQRVGQIEDIVVDLESGQVVGVVIAGGGENGILSDKDRFTVVRMKELTRVGSDEEFRLQIDADKARLLAAPSYPRGEEPDYTSTSYVGYFYEPNLPHAYPPHTTRDDSDTTARERRAETAADNTARNRRDRASQEPTPINQSNEQSDLDVSATIRRELVQRDHLSTNAKNVKIITARGTVTLRGPVANEAEKREIEELAQRLAAGRQVSSQIEIVQL